MHRIWVSTQIVESFTKSVGYTSRSGWKYLRKITVYDFVPEVRAWCTDNLQGRVALRRFGGSLRFQATLSRQNEAVLFKLRWADYLE